MVKLLVSVRDAAESEIAAQSGVDIVDLKEPRHGSLGAVDVGTACEVSELYQGSVVLSLALGELAEWSPSRQRDYPLERFQFAKIGLAGMASAVWQSTWNRWMQSLPAGTQPVAVVYADWQLASSPSPAELIGFALDAGCRTFLIDTFDKQGGALLEHVSANELTRWSRQLNDERGTLVAAGGLQLTHLPAIVGTGVSMVAVRGGVCESGRESTVSARRIRLWRKILSR